MPNFQQLSHLLQMDHFHRREKQTYQFTTFFYCVQYYCFRKIKTEEYISFYMYGCITENVYMQLIKS